MAERFSSKVIRTAFSTFKNLRKIRVSNVGAFSITIKLAGTDEIQLYLWSLDRQPDPFVHNSRRYQSTNSVMATDGDCFGFQSSKTDCRG
ncbi:hypothetical protein T4D_15063 [Trichinella pseudospiralis]|uniref:Uncharacterized protein n=1 Tax=Trichinella pseudospiralis TaxID=6337 RepID=A0A0V1FL19_TRIPS|nr:hypothetical protein T4D_15063 [Trichinella pseudospiralis]